MNRVSRSYIHSRWDLQERAIYPSGLRIRITLKLPVLSSPDQETWQRQYWRALFWSGMWQCWISPALVCLANSVSLLKWEIAGAFQFFCITPHVSSPNFFTILYLTQVFSIFEDLGISVDVVATSEVSISLTLDPSKLWSRELIQQASVRPSWSLHLSIIEIICSFRSLSFNVIMCGRNLTMSSKNWRKSRSWIFFSTGLSSLSLETFSDHLWY